MLDQHDYRDYIRPENFCSICRRYVYNMEKHLKSTDHKRLEKRLQGGGKPSDGGRHSVEKRR